MPSKSKVSKSSKASKPKPKPESKQTKTKKKKKSHDEENICMSRGQMWNVIHAAKHPDADDCCPAAKEFIEEIEDF